MHRIPVCRTLALKKTWNPTQTLTRPGSWLRSQLWRCEPGSSQTFFPRLTYHTDTGVEQHTQILAEGAEVAFRLPLDNMTGNEELETLIALSPLPCGTGREPGMHQKPRAGLKRGMRDLESSKGGVCRAGGTGRPAADRGTTQDSSAAQSPTGITA